MGRIVFALLARLILPRRMRERMGDEILRTHEEVMLGARGPAGRLRLWLAEAAALVVGGVRARLSPAPSGGPRRPTATVSDMTPIALRDDIVHAFRSLSRSPGSTLFVVLILAGGLGTSMVVYSAVRHTLIQPLPYDAADRFAVLWRTVGDSGSRISATPEQAALWGGQEDLVEASLVFATGNRTLTGRGDPAALSAAYVSEGYFRTLGVPLSLGRSFAPEETVEGGPRSVVLGRDLWVRRFGADPGVLGTSIMVDGEPWTVVGVGPDDAPLPTGFPGAVELWLPLTPERPASSAVAVLREGVTIEAFRARIDTLVVRANAETTVPSPFGGTATYSSEMFGARLRGALMPLSVAVGMLLLITCLNASALLVNRADRRRHETAVRVALGVGRLRLARQHVFESLALAVSAGALGLAVAFVGLAAVHRFRPDDLAMLDRAALDPTVALFGFALALGAGLTFGMLPALPPRSGLSFGLLGHGSRGGRDDRVARRWRWGLVVGETALSFALLVSSVLFVRTMISFQQVDVGFTPAGLVVADVTLPLWKYPEASDQEAAWQRMMDGMRSAGGVVSVDRSSGIPTRPNAFHGELELDGFEAPEGMGQRFFLGHGVDEGYFETMRQPIVSGRGFTGAEVRAGADVFVVSASTARSLWPDGDAVGRRMRLGETWHTVVGVVADVPAMGLADEETHTRQLYAPMVTSPQAMLLLRVEGDARAAIPRVAERLRGLAPDAPMELYDAPTALGQSVGVQAFVTRLLSALAILASTLAAVGLYGVMAQTVGRRTREIGIRMSLGARAGGVVWSVLKGGAGAASAGIAIGAALALAGAGVIEGQLFGVAPHDLMSFVSAGVLISLAVLLAAWVPARKAASIDPVRAIMSD